MLCRTSCFIELLNTMLFTHHIKTSLCLHSGKDFGKENELLSLVVAPMKSPPTHRLTLLSKRTSKSSFSMSGSAVITIPSQNVFNALHEVNKVSINEPIYPRPNALPSMALYNNSRLRNLYLYF